MAFCALYGKVITERGDADSITRPGVKRRILVNEKLYQTCPKNP